MTLAQFVLITHDKEKESTFRQRIVCNDGFSMSAQGSSGMYCSPRENSTVFLRMEIGYPSTTEPLIMEWAEESENPTGTVYGYVPVEVIQSVIDKHNGINIDETFKPKD